MQKTVVEISCYNGKQYIIIQGTREMVAQEQKKPLCTAQLFILLHIFFSLTLFFFYFFNLEMSKSGHTEIATPSLLADAFSEHVQATVRLTKVALELEWTVFTRFTVGVIAATFLSIIYLVWTLRHSRRPLVVWEKLNKPLIKIFRPKIFAFLLGNINPYSGSIGKRKL